MKIQITTDDLGGVYCKIADFSDSTGYHKGFTTLYRCDSTLKKEVKNTLVELISRKLNV